MQISAQPLAYSDLDTPLTGMLYRNEALPGRRPGILLVHGGAGLDEHAREQARRYAALGYVVHACDMLGEGAAGDRERVIQWLTALRDDPALLGPRGPGRPAAPPCSPGPGRQDRVGRPCRPAVPDTPAHPHRPAPGRTGGCRSFPRSRPPAA